MDNSTVKVQAPASAPASTAAPSRTAFDHLDTLVRVTSVQSWIYLSILFAVGVGAVVFAMLYQVPTKVDGEGLLLIQQDRLVLVRASATGRLASLKARPGDWVDAGAVIGRIAQEELQDQIHQAKARLADLRSQHEELTRFEEAERQSKAAAIARVRDAIDHARNDGMEKQKIARRLVVGADRLRAEKKMGDLELLESREKLYDVRDYLNKGEIRLADLDLDQVTAENTRKRANLERRLKIGELETKLKLDLEKLERTSRVVSPARGQVAQVQSAIGGLVHEGAPVVLLHAPKVERGPDDDGPAYDTIVFVAAGEGKRIEPGNPVEVVPATVKREEHGFIRGSVVAISELPATRLAMEAALEHPELVESFLKRYAPGVVLRVQVKLDPDDRPMSRGDGSASRGPTNPFRWSSSSGRDQPLKTGTMCQASIVVERRRLIRLILPWTRKVSGTD
jgi:HlyD family secretion protein